MAGSNGHANGNGRAVDFGSFRQFFGKKTYDHYFSLDEAPLVVGKDKLSYAEIARRTNLPVGRTAGMISEIARDHDAISIKDLYKKSSPSSVAVSGFAERGLLMLFAVFASEGLDVSSWARRGINWKTDEGKDNFSTFATYKKRELAAEARTAATPASGPREKGYRRAAMRGERRAERKKRQSATT